MLESQPDEHFNKAMLHKARSTLKNNRKAVYRNHLPVMSYELASHKKKHIGLMHVID